MSDCKYCSHSAELFDIAIPIRDFEMSELYLMKNQIYKGRCIIVCKQHRKEIFELSENELKSYMSETAQAARAIKSAFSADKINYAVFGDTVPHLHFHLVPKYRDGRSWGVPFEMDPKPWTSLEEREYAAIIEEIRKKL